MTLRRISQSLAVLAIAGALAGSSYATDAGSASGAHHRATRQVHHARFTAPVPHKYGPNGMRMGLHCETSDMS